MLVAAATALGCYAVAVWLGEGRGASELALRPALPGFAAAAALGLLMMALLMGILVATGAYDITVVGATPEWTGLGLALQVAVTVELWMRALLLRLLWRAFGPVPSLHRLRTGLRRPAPGQPRSHPARRCHRGHGRTDVLRPLRPDRAALGPHRSHLAWNLAQGYLFGSAVSGGTLGASVLLSTARPEAPSWLTGGTVGPEASVLAPSWSPR